MENIITKYTASTIDIVKNLAKTDDEASLELGLRYYLGRGSVSKNRVSGARYILSAAYKNADALRILIEEFDVKNGSKASDKVSKNFFVDIDVFFASYLSFYPWEDSQKKKLIEYDRRFAHIVSWLYDKMTCRQMAINHLKNRPYVFSKLFQLIGDDKSYLYCLIKGIGYTRNASRIEELHLKLGEQNEYIALDTEDSPGVRFRVPKSTIKSIRIKKIKNFILNVLKVIAIIICLPIIISLAIGWFFAALVYGCIEAQDSEMTYEVGEDPPNYGAAIGCVIFTGTFASIIPGYFIFKFLYSLIIKFL